eukprot:3412730-Rhodomonas_salina.1
MRQSEPDLSAPPGLVRFQHVLEVEFLPTCLAPLAVPRPEPLSQHRVLHCRFSTRRAAVLRHRFWYWRFSTRRVLQRESG